MTVVFTDIEGSTALLRSVGDRYPSILADHFRLMRGALSAHGGVEVKTEGDAIFAVFTDAAEALAACVEAQCAIGAHGWPDDGVVRVRIGVHTGWAEIHDGEYVGMAIHQAARVVRVAHGGQVVCSSATAGEVGDTGVVSLVDLGEFTVRDFDRAERLYQVTAPGDDTSFPPINAVPAIAHNLPLSRTAFFGREKEISDLTGHLDAHRLITLLGPGGMGKTRLAFEVTRRLASSFPDGATVVFLASVSEGERVVPAVAEAMGLLEEVGKPLRTTAVTALSRRKALLVLDNCEQVRGAVAELVNELFDNSPGLAVLCTSRRPMDLPGEVIYPLEPMGVPDADPPLDLAAASDAVRLFVERAQAAKPSFVLDAGTARPVARICRYLEGLPLAIELAAARVRSMPVATLADRIQDTVGLLTTGSGALDTRQRTVTALVDWSLDLLGADELRLLCRLSVFRGGFELEAAEGVCGFGPLEGGSMVDLLDTLVQHSLVAVDEHGRYRLLVVIRDVVGARLVASGEEQAVRSSHLEYFANLAGDARARLHGADQVAFGRQLDLELDNIRAALSWGLAGGGSPGRAGALALGLDRYWARRHLPSEARDWLALIPSGALDRPQALALRRQRNQNDGGKGRAAQLAEYAAILAEAEAAADNDESAEIRLRMATALYWAADYDLAADHLEAALALPISDWLSREIADVLAQVETGRGRLGEAIEAFDRLVEEARAAGDLHREASAMFGRAQAQFLDDDFNSARVDLPRVAEIFHLVGDREIEAKVLNQLAMASHLSHRYAQAREQYQDGLVVARELGARDVETVLVGNLAEVELALGRYSEARVGIQSALEAAREFARPLHQAHWLTQLAAVDFATGAARSALESARAALQLLDLVGHQDQARAAVLVIAAFCALELGDLTSASAHAREGLTAAPGNAQALAAEAVVAAWRGDRDAVHESAVRALTSFAPADQVRPEALALVAAALGGEPSLVLGSIIDTFCVRSGYVIAGPIRGWLEAAHERARASHPDEGYGELQQTWRDRTQYEAAQHVLATYLAGAAAH